MARAKSTIGGMWVNTRTRFSVIAATHGLVKKRSTSHPCTRSMIRRAIHGRRPSSISGAATIV